MSRTWWRRPAGERAQSVVYPIRSENAVAVFALAEVVRDERRTTVRALHAKGVQVAMLTGDGVNDAVASTVD